MRSKLKTCEYNVVLNLNALVGALRPPCVDLYVHTTRIWWLSSDSTDFHLARGNYENAPFAIQYNGLWWIRGRPLMSVDGVP